MIKNILVIGSDSFIGQRFIERYSNIYNITSISRKETKYKNEIVIDNYFKISEKVFFNVDVVINFAAIVHQPDLKDNNLYKKINTELPIYLANEAKKAGVKHFIQMSTIAVYGNVCNISINTPEHPANIYGKTKLAADKALLALQDEIFNVSIIRPPMVYGGGNAPGNMMKLIHFAQRGIPMPFKCVNNERDFINVKNLVNVLSSVIRNNIFGIVIPTDKRPVSTEEIINIVKKYSQSKVRLIKLPKFILLVIKRIKPDIYNKVFDSLKVTCNLSDEIYKPGFSIKDGIKEMMNF